MTDSFGFSADPDPGAPEGTSGHRRSIVVAAGLSGVLALGAGAYFLLSGSPADPVTSVALYRPPVHRVIPPRHTAAAPAPTKAAPSAQLPTASLEHLGRNPFRALYVQPAAVTSTAPSSGTGTPPAPARRARVQPAPGPPAAARTVPAPAARARPARARALGARPARARPTRARPARARAAPGPRARPAPGPRVRRARVRRAPARRGRTPMCPPVPAPAAAARERRRPARLPAPRRTR